jgi:hypothetical protein
MGGKETLLKVVAQAIPVYAMSVFLILNDVCKCMMDAISQFWWGDDENSKKCTRWHGGSSVTPKEMEVWGLGIFTHSILLCWVNRCGDLLATYNFCVLES